MCLSARIIEFSEISDFKIINDKWHYRVCDTGLRSRKRATTSSRCSMKSNWIFPKQFYRKIANFHKKLFHLALFSVDGEIHWVNPPNFLNQPMDRHTDAHPHTYTPTKPTISRKNVQHFNFHRIRYSSARRHCQTIMFMNCSSSSNSPMK